MRDSNDFTSHTPSFFREEFDKPTAPLNAVKCKRVYNLSKFSKVKMRVIGSLNKSIII